MLPEQQYNSTDQANSFITIPAEELQEDKKFIFICRIYSLIFFCSSLYFLIRFFIDSGSNISIIFLKQSILYIVITLVISYLGYLLSKFKKTFFSIVGIYFGLISFLFYVATFIITPLIIHTGELYGWLLLSLNEYIILPIFAISLVFISIALFKIKKYYPFLIFTLYIILIIVLKN